MTGGVREFAERLAAHQDVTDLYRGECKGCGQCCSRMLPMTVLDMVRLKGYVEAHGIEMRPEKPGCIDLTCPFLGDDRLCAVYDARPEICRVYRCDKHKSGELLREFPENLEGAMTMDIREIFDRG